MLESERFTLSHLRDELKATADQAERLARALAELDMVTAAPKNDGALKRSSHWPPPRRVLRFQPRRGETGVA